MAIDYEIKKQAKLALARKDFYYYCQLKTPKFYNCLLYTSPSPRDS